MSDALMAQLASSQGRFATEDLKGLLNRMLCPACGGDHIDIDRVVVHNAASQVMSINLCGRGQASHMHIDIDEPPFELMHVDGEHHAVVLVVRCAECADRSVLSMSHAHGATWTNVEHYSVEKA